MSAAEECHKDTLLHNHYCISLGCQFFLCWHVLSRWLCSKRLRWWFRLYSRQILAKHTYSQTSHFCIITAKVLMNFLNFSLTSTIKFINSSQGAVSNEALKCKNLSALISCIGASWSIFCLSVSSTYSTLMHELACHWASGNPRPRRRSRACARICMCYC